MSEKDIDDKNKELKIEIHNLVNFDPSIKEKFLGLKDALKATINSKAFLSRVINYSYQETSCVGRWWWRRCHTILHRNFKRPLSMTSSEIYDLFISGKDNFNRTEDKDLDLYITLYYSRKNVIGYTYPNTFKTWINKKFFLNRLNSKSGRAAIIGNIVHEYMHNVGFGHSYKNNSTRQHTVPYAYGYIAQSVALRYL